MVGSIVHSSEIQAGHFQGTQSGNKMNDAQFVVGGCKYFYCFFDQGSLLIPKIEFFIKADFQN